MNKNFLKTLTSSILAATMILSLVACGSGNKTADKTTTNQQSTIPVQTSEPVKKDPITLTFSTFNGWAGDSLKAGIKMYEEATGNKVTMDIYPDDQFVNLIKTKLATADVPDLFALYNNQTTIPMMDLEPLEGPWIENMHDAIKKNATRVSDGKIVTAPYAPVSTLGAIYNKEVFKKAGVTLPFKTYADFIAACEAIKKTGITPIYVANKDATGFIFSLAGGQYIFEKDTTLAEKIMTNKIKPSESDLLKEMVTRNADIKKYAQKDYLSGGWQEAQKAVLEGEVGMIFDGSWSYSGMKTTYKDMADKVDGLGFIPVTLGDDFICVTTVANPSSFMVPTSSKHLVEAKEFVNFILQPDVLKVMYEITPGIAPYKNVETIMSPWDEEMQGYIAQGIPSRDQIWDAYLPGFAFGNYGPVIQNIIAGADVNKVLDAWYKEYADLNKAKRTEGF